MNDTTFSNIVAENYNEICRNFKAGLKAKGYPWDEDIMNDAFISCCNTLKDKEISKTEAIKYYWVAYINKYKTSLNRASIFEYHDDMEEVFDDIETEKYNSTTDRIYDIIITELQDHYGVRKATIWEMYACQGMSSKEIRAMGLDDIDNYAYFTKQVKRYIKNHIIPENRELQELIAERKES
jgi:integrase